MVTYGPSFAQEFLCRAPDVTTGLYLIVHRNDGLAFDVTQHTWMDCTPENWGQFTEGFVAKGSGIYRCVIQHDTLTAGEHYIFSVYEMLGEQPASTDRLRETLHKANWGVIAPDAMVGDPIDHNTGSTDALRVVDTGGNGIDGVVIRAYLATDYTDNASAARVQGLSVTLADGRWERPIYRDPSLAYTLTMHAAGKLVGLHDLPAEGT
ncbi:MAG TPA: hypothetical protein VGN72_07795 [Tepidisphaeraceae bacterium]|jgi:hypothetical protein|nr:hypothetical protein [Tepidisphaeraceae bacterium]